MRASKPRATPVREGDSALVRVLEATIETLTAENEMLRRRLADAEAARENAKAEAAIERLRARAAALGADGSQGKRGMVSSESVPGVDAQIRKISRSGRRLPAALFVATVIRGH